MMPNFVCKADELVLDFDHWKDVVLTNFSSELTPAQKAGLAALDSNLSEMTRAGPTLWTEDSVRQSHQRLEVRVLAVKLLSRSTGLQRFHPAMQMSSSRDVNWR
jgi:hypothetical protein